MLVESRLLDMRMTPSLPLCHHTASLSLSIIWVSIRHGKQHFLMEAVDV